MLSHLKEMDKHLQVSYLCLELGHKLALHSEHKKKHHFFRFLFAFQFLKVRPSIEFSIMTNLRKQTTKLLGLVKPSPPLFLWPWFLLHGTGGRTYLSGLTIWPSLESTSALSSSSERLARSDTWEGNEYSICRKESIFFLQDEILFMN